MKALITLFFIVFVDLLGFGMIIPVLPFYARTFGASAEEIGWLMGFYSLGQFVMAPIWGKLSDRVGRKPVLQISLFGSVIFYVLISFAETKWLLMLARLGAGLMAANISTAYAYVSDVTTEENRSRGMGMLGAALGLGFTLGPPIGGLLSQWGESWAMQIVAAISFLNLLMTTLFLKESRSMDSSKKKTPGARSPLSVLRDPQAGTAIILFALFTLAITQLEVMFPVYMADHFFFNAKTTGFFMGAMGFLMVLVQGGLIGRITDKMGERSLSLLAMGVAGVSLIAFSYSAIIPLVAVSLAFLALSRGCLHPSLSSLTSLGASSEVRGMAMGMFHSGSALARVLGPILAGFLYQHISPRSPFLASALLLMIGLLVGLCRLPRLVRKF